MPINLLSLQEYINTSTWSLQDLKVEFLRFKISNTLQKKSKALIIVKQSNEYTIFKHFYYI